MALSLNWKALSSKIKTKTTNADKIQKKPFTSNHKSKIQNKKHIDTIEKSIIPTTSNTVTLDPISATLWLNENDIESKDISKQPMDVEITSKSTKDRRKKGLGKYLSMDCEFVGVGADGKESVLARVSIVNYYGYVIFDSFVKPTEKVTDWRTWISGVSPSNMHDAIDFKEAQEKVSKILEGRILVGHSIHHDLESLFLSHPKMKIRDTSKYKAFKDLSMGKTPSLKKLTEHYVGIEIQNGAHSSVVDARATMLLFRMNRREFEKAFAV